MEIEILIKIYNEIDFSVHYKLIFLILQAKIEIDIKIKVFCDIFQVIIFFIKIFKIIILN